jgi:enamine deaminase RidA (YjgF/YER057c/UK114 family)
MRIEHVNPSGLSANPAFTQVVTVESPARLAFVGGQNAVTAGGAIIGEDLGSQTAQALRNVLTALAAVGADQTNVVRLGIYVVQGHEPRAALAAAQEVWGGHATAITVLSVAALAHPAFLVEIEATAALP